MKILYCLLTLIGLFISNTTVAQAADTTYYVQEYFRNQVTSINRYHRLVSKVPDSSGVFKFHETDLIDNSYKEGSYISYTNDTEIGRIIAYYSSGMIKYKGLMKNWDRGYSSAAGTWQYFRPDGQKEKEYKYVLDMENKKSIKLYWSQYDGQGHKVLENGNGIWRDSVCHETMNAKCYIKTGLVKNGLRYGEWKATYVDCAPYYIEQYDSSILIKGISYDDKGNKYEYMKWEEQPEYPGGVKEMISFLKANIQYPLQEQDNNITGKVIMGFAVTPTGEVEDIRIMRGVSPNIDREALRVVGLLPKFIPGKQMGQPVSVYFTMPITFGLL